MKTDWCLLFQAGENIILLSELSCYHTKDDDNPLFRLPSNDSWYHKPFEPQISKRSSGDQLKSTSIKYISLTWKKFILGAKPWLNNFNSKETACKRYKKVIPFTAMYWWVHNAPLRVRTLTSPLCLTLASILLAQEDSSSWLEDIVPPFLPSFLAAKRKQNQAQLVGAVRKVWDKDGVRLGKI